MRTPGPVRSGPLRRHRLQSAAGPAADRRRAVGSVRRPGLAPTDTLLERDLPDLLWAQVNQRQVEALDRKLDANEAAQEDAPAVLLHGGAPRGAERIAACWADQRKVAEVVFKPDWAAHARAAPFKRNDVLLEALPIGVIVLPGAGVTANLADKARRLGIPVWRFGGAEPRRSSLLVDHNDSRRLFCAHPDSMLAAVSATPHDAGVYWKMGSKTAHASGEQFALRPETHDYPESKVTSTGRRICKLFN